MRLAVCALSAVLLSGCSWLGMGGNSAGYNGAGVYGADCGGYGTSGAYNIGGSSSCGGAGYGQAGYGVGAGYGQAGYGAGAGYGQAGYGAGAGYGQAGYGAGAGYGQAGYGAGAGYGQAGYGVGGYNAAALGLGAAGAYGAAGYGQTTTLGTSAPYGSAVGGAYGATQYGATTQYGTQGNVTTVAGAPIYVPQPYPSYYGVPQLRGVPVAVAGGALPFGLELGVGTSFDIDGDILTPKPGGGAIDASGNPVTGVGARTVSALPGVGYDDAFEEAIVYSAAATYDVDPYTTVLGRFAYSEADGEEDIAYGTASEGNVTDAPISASFSDLEQYTLEAGVRRYLGQPTGFRPYVGANAGFTYTDDVSFTQTSAAFANGSETQNLIDGGWTPTAAGIIGAEYAVGGRTAIGIETGIRWSDDLDSVFPSEDRWSVPVSLRGRVSF